MAFLFNRTASIVIGKEGEEAPEISGLRIKFNIEKTSESTSNTAKIQVFNMNPTNRGRLEEKDLIVILRAGYAGINEEPIEELIFKGNVSKTQTIKQGADYVSTIECGDGEKALLEKHLDKSFESGTKLTAIIDELKNTLGLAVADIKDITTEQFVNGGSISGTVKNILDKLTERMGLTWNIQDEELHIQSPTTVNETEAVLVSAQTGLISEPIKREKGIEVLSFLNPKFRPNRTMKIESDRMDSEESFFRIRKVNFTGDTHDGDWLAKIEAIRPE
jgi:hypothetical protein